jgi:hypothetical protein
MFSEQPDFPGLPAAGVPGPGRKLQVPTEDLRKAWAVSRRISKDDWLEWYNGLCREFLKVTFKKRGCPGWGANPGPLDFIYFIIFRHFYP